MFALGVAQGVPNHSAAVHLHPGNRAHGRCSVKPCGSKRHVLMVTLTQSACGGSFPRLGHRRPRAWELATPS